MCLCYQAGGFSSVHFLYSKCTLSINGIHQPSPLICDHPELSALLTLAPAHVLVKRVQTKPYAAFALSSMLFIEGVRTCSMPSLSFAGCLPTAMHAFYLHCNQQNPVNPKKESDLILFSHLLGYTASKTRQKAPFAVLMLIICTYF